MVNIDFLCGFNFLVNHLCRFKFFLIYLLSKPVASVEIQAITTYVQSAYIIQKHI